MVPFDAQTVSKLDAAIQQVEAAIELFYAKQYVPAITLAGAAEGCVAWGGDLETGKPLFELLKRNEKLGKTERERTTLVNAVRDWLKHETRDRVRSIEVSNYDAWYMIARAVTKIEAAAPGSETPTIVGFIKFSREHYRTVLQH